MTQSSDPDPTSPSGPALRVLLFAGLRQRAGTAELRLSVDLPLTVAELRQAVIAAHPALAEGLDHCRVAI
ncbi:MAG: hypothetical protein KC431_23660, partial [Myxococcales bacterium]|nr:hypothetical protein [Myxococcales bacterium]